MVEYGGGTGEEASNQSINQSTIVVMTVKTIAGFEEMGWISMQIHKVDRRVAAK
jgi:hypothetical protein